MVGDLVSEDLRGFGFSLLSVAIGVSLLLGNLIFGYLWDKFGSPAAFYWSAVTTMSALVVLLFLRYDTPRQGSSLNI